MLGSKNMLGKAIKHIIDQEKVRKAVRIKHSWPNLNSNDINGHGESESLIEAIRIKWLWPNLNPYLLALPSGFGLTNQS